MNANTLATQPDPERSTAEWGYWLNCAPTILTCLVPLFGVLFYEWSGVVVILLFWVENTLGTVFTAARIVLHRRLTHKRGHWRRGQLENQKVPNSGTLLRDYLYSSVLSIVFQGIFIAVFALFAVFVLIDQHPDWDGERLFSLPQLEHGAASLALSMALAFALDVRSLRQRSFLWLKVYVAQKHERWITLFFSLLLGFFVMFPTQSPLALAYVLIALNTATVVYQLRVLRKLDTLPLVAWLRQQVETRNRRAGIQAITPAQQRQIDTQLRQAQEDEQVASA